MTQQHTLLSGKVDSPLKIIVKLKMENANLQFKIKSFAKILGLIFLCLYFFRYSSLFAQNDDNHTADTLKYKTETIEVNALLGIDRLTPVTFQNIARDKIEKNYWMQDLPMFLNGSTSINAYSESGASIGYSYFSIRGFDQRRVSILSNGVPQNDAEDHQVYWVDLSDITSSVESIQIQRGIGTALYGTSGIGGVINLQTIDFFNRSFLNINAGYGDYTSRRYSMEYSSGLTNSGFGFYGKLTKTNSNGYRDLSWSDHWSYFLSAGKTLGSNTIIKFNVYGSPIKNHLAYQGVTKDYLDGKITGDARTDRRYNPLTYNNESDNYHQPHYELVLNTQASKNVYISNTFNYTRGEGYFITNYPAAWGYDFSYFRLNPFYTSDSTTFNSTYYKRNPDGTLYHEAGKGYVIDKSDLVTNLYVNNSDYGWYPKVQIKHNGEKGNLVIGGEVRLHKSEHYGEVAFGDALPQGTPDNYQYYFYNGKKTSVTAFANEVYSLTKNLTAMLGLQFAYHKYTIENDKFKPYAFSVDYNFFTPRAGLNYNISDNFHVFGNVSMARREPRLKDIYDAESPYSAPNFRIVDTVNKRYEDPLVKPEEMTDFELGIGYTSAMLKSNLNFYQMNFTNEIVSNGQLDNVGQPINGNAGKSVHRGVEFDFELHPFVNLKKDYLARGITVSGNLNLSDNYFKEYREILGTDAGGNIIYGNDYSDNKILLNPSIIANLTLGYQTEFGLNIYFTIQHIGKQYLDNSENERKNPDARLAPGYVDKIINAYTVFNAGLSFDVIPALGNGNASKNISRFIRSFELSLKVNNIFDRLYETTGSVDSYGIPYWIPAADRNLFCNLKIGF
ncbi:MAG: TonB-dependent receptor [Ignavibacteria bacterium]|nr:TonB-dependent receptor [Ignavibacteria bacterium]